MLKDFQEEMLKQYHFRLGPDISNDERERKLRFLAHAVCLVQSLKLSCKDAHTIVDFIYLNQEEPTVQEVGNVMLTLTALCSSVDVDMDSAVTAAVAGLKSKKFYLDTTKFI